MIDKQAEYNRYIVSLLELHKADRILDLGCDTGVLTRMIADQMDAGTGGVSVGIDAVARIIQVARKKRGNQTKIYMSSANVINFGLPKNVCCVPDAEIWKVRKFVRCPGAI